MFSLNETPHKRNLHTLISTTTALLVSLLAPGALVLSYNALRGVATAYGLSGWQSYVWPLLLDFALVVFSLAVVRNALLRERTLWPWTLKTLQRIAKPTDFSSNHPFLSQFVVVSRCSFQNSNLTISFFKVIL